MGACFYDRGKGSLAFGTGFSIFVGSGGIKACSGHRCSMRLFSLAFGDQCLDRLGKPSVTVRIRMHRITRKPGSREDLGNCLHIERDVLCGCDFLVKRVGLEKQSRVSAGRSPANRSAYESAVNPKSSRTPRNSMSRVESLHGIRSTKSHPSHP